ncbi:MAG: cobalamin biosynthesis protein CbiG [Desulfobulbus propionicus]|nr:MAG: cobalamin biosynthesis protein CbiG [Desulfobulbus propionicus]
MENTFFAGRLAVVYLTRGGARLAERIGAAVIGAEVVDGSSGVRKVLARLWPEIDGLICIMAAGIVVRAIAPLTADKRTDPAVVVCDEAGRFAVSLLSGHLGGANELARQLADLTGGQAVITTASDVLGRTALDLWCRKLGLTVSNKSALTRAMSRLVNDGKLRVYSQVTLPELPADLIHIDSPEKADLVVSCATLPVDTLLLYPRALAVGIGCNRGTSASDIGEAVRTTFQRHNLALESVRTFASIDVKADEQGLLTMAHEQARPLIFFDRKQLNSVEGIQVSAAALRATGAKGVAEPSAILAAKGGFLLVPKQVFKDVTVAIALDEVLHLSVT